MRINQNVMAANASRNLSNTNIQLGKSLEKLSSGFRINRAADDAAGLVISQGLRAQISGLRQATRNAQDGISVVQTAEGALNEVHTMLTRMRDLAVQAANSGANDTAARGAAQTEISALATEITRVSTQRPLRRREPAQRHLRRHRSQQDRHFGGDSLSRPLRRATFTININGVGAVTVSIGAQAGVTGTAAAAATQTAIRRLTRRWQHCSAGVRRQGHRHIGDHRRWRDPGADRSTSRA